MELKHRQVSIEDKVVTDLRTETSSDRRVDDLLGRSDYLDSNLDAIGDHDSSANTPPYLCDREGQKET